MGIFARYGFDFDRAKLGGGWSNATWLGGGFALRMAVKPGTDRIRREVELAGWLPFEVGYPTLVEIGVTEGYEWCLSREVPGDCLGDVWQNLRWEERKTALRQLWEKAQTVHSVDIEVVGNLARKRAWYNSCSAEEAEAALVRLEGHKMLDPRQAANLRKALGRFWDILPSSEAVLNHGDLTLDNAIWFEGRVVSLLDFEFAVTAPAELDLNVLVKHAFRPEEETNGLSETDARGWEELRRLVIDLARPVLDHPGGKDLLLGYAILLELWALEDWLAHPEGEGPVEQWEPYRRLLSLADGQAGYLAPVLLGPAP